MNQRERLARLEEIAAERRATRTRCICRTVFIDATKPLSEEQKSVLARNAKCPVKPHDYFDIVEVVPQGSDTSL